jgi:hypothetical protein
MFLSGAVALSLSEMPSRFGVIRKVQLLKLNVKLLVTRLGNLRDGMRSRAQPVGVGGRAAAPSAASRPYLVVLYLL